MVCRWASSWYGSRSCRSCSCRSSSCRSCWAAPAGAAFAGAASAGAPLTCAALARQTASPTPGGTASTEWTAPSASAAGAAFNAPTTTPQSSSASPSSRGSWKSESKRTPPSKSVLNPALKWNRCISQIRRQNVGAKVDFATCGRDTSPGSRIVLKWPKDCECYARPIDVCTVSFALETGGGGELCSALLCCCCCLLPMSSPAAAVVVCFLRLQVIELSKSHRARTILPPGSVYPLSRCASEIVVQLVVVAVK